MPAYLAGLLASNAEGQVGPNTPFQQYAPAVDGVAAGDQVVASVYSSAASIYSSRIYGTFAYGAT